MATAAVNEISTLYPQLDRVERFYLPELDALRFFAFLAVFTCHAWDIRNGPNCLADMGTFGVDLFFTLSAYLITELLLREKERSGKIDVSAFYVRRILRIWPLYFAFLAAAFATSSMWPVLRISWLYFAACAAFIGNFGFYWLGSPSLIISPLWSISVEEQFYISWPLMVRSLTQRTIVITAVLLWTFSIITRWFMTREGVPLLIVFGTFGRLDPIACGILLSAIQRTGAWRHPTWIVRVSLIIAGVWLWLMADLLAMNGVMIPVYAAVAVGCTAFMVATIGAGGWIRNRCFVYLGRISYGLYIYHGAVLVAANRIAWMRHEWLLMSSFALVSTIAIAAASYRWLETPFLRMKARFQVVRSGNPVYTLSRNQQRQRSEAQWN